MNYSVCVLIVYLYNDLYCRLQTFPCDFNVYEETKDGLITITEFSNYTKKHGYDVEQSKLVFSTLDSNSNYIHA